VTDSSDMDSNTSPAPGSNQVAQQLWGEILSGRAPEGLRLTEEGLAKRFGVGRSLVREAVQRLSLQGLVQTRPNRGAIVAPEAPREIRNLIVPIRRTVEVYSLQLIFDELNDEDFRRWDDILARMQAACERKDFHSIAELDIAFHRYLLERTGQPDLLIIWETLVGRIRSHFLRTQRRCPNPMEIYEEHRAILDSFRDGSLEEAVRMLKGKIA
jgi:DNA-binding GntR family transcriptional regulator